MLTVESRTLTVVPHAKLQTISREIELRLVTDLGFPFVGVRTGKEFYFTDSVFFLSSKYVYLFIFPPFDRTICYHNAKKLICLARGLDIGKKFVLIIVIFSITLTLYHSN